MSAGLSPSAVPEFSLVRGGPLYSLRQFAGLVPEKGLGLAKRAAILVAFTWLPIVVGAIVEKQFFPGYVADPLLRHFGVHARLLIAIPLLIFAEAAMERVVPAMVRQFTVAGLVTGLTRDEFGQVLHEAEGLRDSVWGKLLVSAAVLGTLLMPVPALPVGVKSVWNLRRTAVGRAERR